MKGNSKSIYGDYKGKIKSISIDGKDYPVKYSYSPSYVRRGKYSGLAVAVGKTTAKVTVDGVEHTAIAECWVNEPFLKENGQVVSLGRLVKQFGLRLKNGKVEKR